MKWRRLLVLFLMFSVLFVACGDDDKDDDNNTTYDEVFIEETVDNTALEGALDITITEVTFDLNGTDLVDGATVDERLIQIAGTIPSTYARENEEMVSSERINLHGDGGSCMTPGDYYDEAEFTIDFTQTISVSYYTQGICCTGATGYEVGINDASGNSVWNRQVHQSTGMDVDQETGSKTLPAGTYTFYVNAITGTDTYAEMNYTPGTGGVLGSTIVVYHNGHLYPIADVDAGTSFSYSLDLERGNNTIRILIVGNFDQSARQALENILGASDIVNLTCMTDELGIRCVLTWGIDNSDVDLHFIAPGGYYTYLQTDCYFGNMTPDWGVADVTIDNPMLDVDNTSGYGPETLVLPSPANGLYSLVIHYWGDHGGGDAPSRVQVTLNESDTRLFGPRSLVEYQEWIVTGIQVTNGVASFASAPDSADIHYTYPVGVARPLITK